MNYFGIKSHGRAGGQTLQTSEFEGGRMVSQPASFRGYGSPEQSFQDYADFLLTNPRYRGVLSAVGIENQIAEMAKSGYATDPQYGTKLASIASKFDPNAAPIIGADALRAIGKGPSENITRSTKQGDSMEPITQPQQRQGLLGGFFGPEGRDARARLAIGLEGMTLNPNQALIGQLQQGIESRETARQRNATVDWLRSRGRDDLADALMAGASPQSVMSEAIRPVDVDANVQSSTALPDQSGVVLTMRDGSVQVRTVGGETLSGQAALDYVRQAQERSAEYQRSIYAARETGKLEAGAAAAAPGEIALFNTLEFQVNDLLNDPYLPNMLGPIASRTPNITADAARVQSKMDQISGGAFLQARQLLKGGGAITDFESKKAEQAFIRMNAAQNKEDFRKAMTDFLDAARAGLPKLQAAAPGAGATGAAPAAPGQPTTRLRYNPATGAFE
jgi:hypothetical protein